MTSCDKRNKRRSRSVAFHSKATVYPTLGLHEYSDAERVGVFYQRENYHGFKQSAKILASYLKDCDKGSARGLEQFNAAQRCRLIERRDIAYDIVISQAEGVLSLEMMVQYLLVSSETSQQEARSRGNFDAFEALKALKNNEDTAAPPKKQQGTRRRSSNAVTKLVSSEIDKRLHGRNPAA